MKKALVTALMILMGMVLAGCLGKTQNDKTFHELAFGEEGPVKLTSEQHEQVGDGYMRRNKPEMAFIHYNRAIEQDAENLDVRVKKGELLVLQGVDEQALAEFNQVLKKDADHAIANESAGAVYFRAGLYDEAEAHLEKAVRLNPMLWKAHNYLGILYDRENNFDKASEHFSMALDLHHGNDTDEIYNNLGVVHIARKQYGLAVDAFRHALKNGGVDARTYNNLGLALTRLGRLEEALESFKYAGGESKAHNNLGYVLMTDGKPAKAIPYFEKAIELSPNYYVKAADNLKRARMAARFQSVGSKKRGSTPNPLLRKSFPDAEGDKHRFFVSILEEVEKTTEASNITIESQAGCSCNVLADLLYALIAALKTYSGCLVRFRHMLSYLWAEASSNLVKVSVRYSPVKQPVQR